ncbi:MAG TPA: tol-pal system protein YbgF [Caulobacteraceae bacterium]|jgi:tol-pal system protein YbgF
MSLRLPLRLLLAGALAVSLAGPAAAQDAKALNARMERLEKLVRQLRDIVVQARQSGDAVQVRIVGDPDPDVITARRRLDDLEAAVQTLNGQVDGLTRDVQLARQAAQEQRGGVERAADRAARADQETRARLEDLNQRLLALEAAARPAVEPAPGAAGPEEAGPPADDPAEAFAQAKRLLLAESYPAASAAFQEFIERFPEAEQAPEARYWLGEALFVQNAYADAATAYIGAIRGWPQTPWAPNAVVKLARSLIALEKPKDACRTLGEFKKRYPKAPKSVSDRAAAARTEAKCA